MILHIYNLCGKSYTKQPRMITAMAHTYNSISYSHGRIVLLSWDGINVRIIYQMALAPLVVQKLNHHLSCLFTTISKRCLDSNPQYCACGCCGPCQYVSWQSLASSPKSLLLQLKRQSWFSSTSLKHKVLQKQPGPSEQLCVCMEYPDKSISFHCRMILGMNLPIFCDWSQTFC